MALMLLAAPIAVAASPANDAFADATTVAGELPIRVTGANVEATKETGEPRHAGSPGGRSVWYSWTATSTQKVVIDTCQHSFDTLLAVYTGGAVGALTPIAGNDDTSGCGTGSQVKLSAVAGTTYRIVIDGYNGQSGTFTLALDRLDTPANDDFAGARELSGALPIMLEASTIDGSHETGEPRHAGAGGEASVWFSWTAPDSAPVAVETCGSDFDTVLAVYTGTAVNALSVVAGNDDVCGQGSAVRFRPTAGTRYMIAVDGVSRVATGTFKLALRRANPPANDDYANARMLSGVLPIDVEATNVDATRERGEPRHASNDLGGGSVWFRWTAPTTDTMWIETCGSEFDTLLAVYTGDSVDTLTKVAGNDQSFYCNTFDHSTVMFNAIAGRTYTIAVDGYQGANGRVALAIRNRPPNDAFADAQQLTGPLPIGVRGTVADATHEPGEPSHHGYFLSSAWYTWTPSDSGRVAIETCSGETPTQLAIYTGDSVSALAEVASAAFSEDCYSESASGGRVIIDAVAGTRYRIAVERSTSITGPITLTIRRPGSPSNDDFAAAESLPASLPVSVAASNVDASRETGEPHIHAYDADGASVWYRWTPDVSGPVVVETCTSDFSAMVGVFRGDRLDALEAVDGESVGCGEGWRYTFTAEAGRTYRIAIAGQYNDSGTSTLAIRRPNLPANDDFAAARVLDGPLPLQVAGSNVDATREADEPDGVAQRTSIWYRWTPQASAIVAIETCGSDFDTILSLYTGDAVDGLTRVAADNDTAGCGDGRQSRVLVPVMAGTTYSIAVRGWYGGGGSVALTLRTAVPPTNDDFDAARPLTGDLPVTAKATNVDATRQAGEPVASALSADDRASVWYRWTAGTSGPVVIDTCAGALDTVLAVYDGSRLGEMTEQASNRAGCGLMTGHIGSRVRIDAVAGRTYKIAVSGQQGATGPIALSLRRADPPVNENPADAQVLAPGLPVTLTASNADASGALWYAWTPSTTAKVVLDTCGSDFAVDLDIASSTGVEVAPERARCSIWHETSVSFTARAGTEYRIAVDSPGDRGTFHLRLDARPTNDDIGDAKVIGGGFKHDITGTNARASKQPGEPDHAGNPGGSSVWYSWTPTRSGRIVIKGCKSAFPIRLSAYTGTAVNRLTTVAGGRDTDGCGEGSGGKLAFNAAAGQTYLIALDGAGGAEGKIDLTFRADY